MVTLCDGLQKQINMAGNNIRNHIIEECFHMGFSYKEIIDRLF